MRKFFILPILLLSFFDSLTQNQAVIDSLLLKLEADITKEEVFGINLEIAQQYMFSDSSKTYTYANEALNVSQKMGKIEGQIDVLFPLGWINIRRGNFELADSLLQRMLHLSNTSNYRKAISNAQMGLGYLNYNQSMFDNAIALFNQSLVIKEKISDQKGIGYCHNYLGSSYFSLGSHDQAFHHYQKSLEIRKQINDFSGISDSYHNIAMNHSALGQYRLALNNFFQSLSMDERVGNEWGIGMGHSHIGLTYRRMGEQERAIHHYEKSLKIAERLDDKFLMIRLMNYLGTMSHSLNEFDQAIQYFDQVIDMSHIMGYERELQAAYCGLGGVYYEIGNLELALENASRGVAINRRHKRDDRLTRALIRLGEIHLAKDELALARKSLDEALILAQRLKAKAAIRDAVMFLSKLEEREGNFQTALEYYTYFKAISDSVPNTENTKKITMIEAEYEFSQERDSIQVANQIQQASLSKDLENRERIQVITATGLVIILGLLAYLFILYNKKRKSMDKLDRLTRTQNRMFGIIAHDIRGPLSSFQGIAEIVAFNIRKGNLTALEQMGDQIDQSMKRVDRLFSELLEWSLSREEAIPFKRKKLNAQNVVEEVISYYQEVAGSKGISIELEGAISDSFIYGDANTIKTVLRNLINNSLKFTPFGGGISIFVEENGKLVTYIISDNGVGMNEDQVRSLFRKESKSQSKGTNNEKGTGFGLILVHDFVEKNKGRIEVSSTLGVGTTFKVSFPKAKTRQKVAVSEGEQIKV